MLIRYDLEKRGAPLKIMHAVNNGPVHKRHATDQFKSNFLSYKALNIPYARNHDASHCSSYGGEHTVDITAIFPNFSADENDPLSYDFACTDEYTLVTLDAGTETFFRLGQKIEHYIKKYGTLPPPDFEKWARICEHIIRHYNEGWADGYHLNIKYWEIWNEADLDPDDSKHKRTWGGTWAQFLDLYEITAKHLKKCFPSLKIGGPALSRPYSAENFLRPMSERGVPIDFLSWHAYRTEPRQFVEFAKHVREKMIEYGYGNAESILNEWNYVRGWEEDFVYSIEQIIGLKGAAFTLASMIECQRAPVDMLMYYDARPSAFNGLFDFYSYKTLKGYYPFLWYSKLYDCGYEASLEELSGENLYTIGAVDMDGKALIAVVNYSECDTAPAIDVTLDIGRAGEYEIYAIDEAHNGTLVDTVKSTDGRIFLSLPLFTSLLVKEK